MANLRRPALLSVVLAGLVLLMAGCALPRWPVEGPVSSPFGIRWNGWTPAIHRGIDIAVPTGTPVRAMRGGRVRFAGEMRGYGKVIWLEHRGGSLSAYAHLSELRVRTGEQVSGGQVIALSGATGRVTGPHLHFEVWVSGRPVDPALYLGGRP